MGKRGGIILILVFLATVSSFVIFSVGGEGSEESITTRNEESSFVKAKDFYVIVSAKEIRDIDDSDMLNKFTQLKGFKDIRFDVFSSRDFNVREIEKMGSVQDNKVKNVFRLNNLEVETEYEERDTSFFNVDERPIKQTYIIRNLLDEKRDVRLGIKHEIDSSIIRWNGTEYDITETPRYFEAFYVEDEIFLGITEPSLTGHTLYFEQENGLSYYDFKDVVNLNYKVSVYSDAGKSYIGLEVEGGIGGKGEFIIDPEIGWTTRVITTSVDGANSVFAIDIDDDGDIDVLSASRFDDKIAWYENDGASPPSWTTRVITTSADRARFVFAIDLDNDSDIDVLSASVLDNKIAWYENDGSTPPNWTARTITTSADGAISVFAIDIDNDDDIDVLSASVDDDTIAWYENDGSSPPGWTTRVITTSLDGAYSVFAIDIDIDNDNDIDVLSAAEFDEVAWYENDGSSPPSWTTRIITNSTDLAISVYAIDIDNDNDIDVLSASYNDDKIAWYENDGSSPPNWTARTITTSADGAVSVFAIDVDNDNDIDVLSASRNDDKIAWYENDGSSPPSWTVNTIAVAADGARDVFAIDLDNDNDIDVLNALYFGDKIEWYESDLHCSGTIQAIVEDSNGGGIENIKVFLNNTFQDSTDNLGVLELGITGDACGVEQTIDVKCSDDTFCGSDHASIDYNGEQESVIFDCTMCLGGGDLFISQQDVIISSSGSDSVVNVTVHSVNIEADNNLSVRFQTIGGDGLVKDTTTNVISIAENSETTTSATFDLSDKDFVAIYVDPENDFFEQKTNNFVQRSTIKRIKASFDVATGISKADEAIEDFLEAFAEPVSVGDADVIISVGRFSSNVVSDIVDSQTFIDDNGWGFQNELVFADGQYLELPYNGAVGSYGSGTPKLVALGTDIDGTIAAVKKMAAAGSVYFNDDINERPVLILDRYDLTALGTYDILHNSENNPYYRQNNDNFKTAVAKTLGGNTYDIAIRRVNTTGSPPVTLRIKNVNSEFSQDYVDAVVVNPMPVVLSRGLWSNLLTWDEFGKELAADGRDTWLIEITGGPLIERDSDPNYNYSDLVDEYWPASLAAIQYFTNKITTQYVGFSNGCRVGLSSLESYQDVGKSDVAIVQNLQTGNDVTVDLQAGVGAPVVDTFVGVGCPGAFEGDSLFISCMENHGRDVLDYFDSIGQTHVSLDEFAQRLVIESSTFGFPTDPLCYILGERLGDDPTSISLALGEAYLSFILNQTDSQLGNFSVNRTQIIYGTHGLFDNDDDIIVTQNDANAIFNNLDSSDKRIDQFHLRHDEIPESQNVLNTILERLGT